MMKYLQLLTFLLVPFLSFSQITTVDVGMTVGFLDSTFIIQTGQTDTLNTNKHPGAGNYQNGEILVCKNASLVYDFMQSTSSNPTFYLEEGASLIMLQSMFDFKIYMKANSTVDFNAQQVFAKIKRDSSATFSNYPMGSSNIFDTIFANVNFTFTNWPSALSPCNNPAGIENENLNSMFSISPIPANNTLNIQGNIEKISSIKINNILGETFFSQQSNFEKIDISLLNTGIYFITLKTKNNLIQVVKFVKE